MDRKKIILSLVAIMCICVLGIVFMIIFGSHNVEPEINNKDNISILPESNNVITENPDSEPVQPSIKGDELPEKEMFEIETPYCKVKYPSEWGENVEYICSDENGVFSIEFISKIKNQDIKMFEIFFNGAERGQKIGYLLTNGEKILFSGEIGTFVPGEDWSDEEKDLYYSMVEGINYIIKSVESNENYVKD